MLVFNAKRLIVYLLQVCLVVGLLPVHVGCGRERKKGRESYVPCPHPKCQCKPTKHGDVTVRCIKVLETLPEFLDVNVTFAELNLNKRNLTSLPERGFWHIRTRVLDVGSNAFGEGHVISERAFEGLEEVLEVLWLNDCRLKETPLASLSILTELKVLHIEENRISEISSRFLRNNSKLVELYLYRNNIQTIKDDAFADMTQLQQLKLGQNRIQTLQAKIFRSLSNLTSLDLSQNFIQEIVPGVFDGLQNLRWLELESNLIQSLSRDSFKGARSLRNMKIENNQFSTIADNTFRAINKLGYLSIDIVNVSALTANTFGGLGRLQTLSIGEVAQPIFPAGFFSSMRKLRRLSLTDNAGQFIGLNRDMFAERFSFKNLSMFVSPIRSCRCNEQWIRNMTGLGAYVHGFCADNRPLSCTAKVSSKHGSSPQKHINRERKKKLKETDVGTDS